MPQTLPLPLTDPDLSARAGRDFTQAEFEARLAKYGWVVRPSRRDASVQVFWHPGCELEREGHYVKVGRRRVLRRRETLSLLIQALSHYRHMVQTVRRAVTEPFALPLVPPAQAIPPGVEPIA